MADSDNYLKVRDGKQAKVFFFSLRTFGIAYRAALKHRDACTRAGGVPTLSVYTHPLVKGKPLLPSDITCVGRCDVCGHGVLDPDADDN